MSTPTPTVLVGAIPPPPGVTPNFVDPVSIGYRLIVVGVLFLVLGTFFISIRFYTKLIILHALGWEDAFSAMAYLCAVGEFACIIAEVHYGLGRHFWNIPVGPGLDKLKKLYVCGVVLYTVSIMFSKVSILLFYRRIWPQRRFQVVNWILMAVVVGYSVALALPQTFPCRPLGSSYSASIPAEQCVNVGAYGYSQAAFNIATDIAMLIIPVVLLHDLAMPLRERIGAGIWLALGSFTMVCAIIRIPMLKNSVSSIDTTWVPVNPGITTVTEQFLGVICASFATMRPFLRKLFPRLFPVMTPSPGHSGKDRPRSGGVDGAGVGTMASDKQQIQRDIELGRHSAFPPCDTLASVFPSSVSTPNVGRYKDELLEYFSAQEREVEPSCIVSPRSPEDVSVILKNIQQTQGQCQFAIKGGGHMPWGGAANIADGITIDLERMRDVTVTPDGDTVAVEAGARWGDVYSLLDPMGIAVSGGRYSSVGVGGLTTGGGNSFFAARYGLVCDNVKNFEVVLASSEIVNANASSNSDLFRVLKGGGNNFGIVTRFDLNKILNQAKLWTNTVIYPIETTKQQCEEFTKFADKIDEDPNGSIITNIFGNGTSKEQSWINYYDYTKPEETDPAVFDGLRGIPGASGPPPRVTTLKDRIDELLTPPGARSSFATTTFANDAAVFEEVIKIGNELLDTFPATPNVTFIREWQPLPQAITKYRPELGPNIIGLNRNKGVLNIHLNYFIWTDPTLDNLIEDLSGEMIRRIDEYTKSVGAYNEFKYYNYARGDQDPLSGYGEENFNLIKAASLKYDPDQVFQRLVPGGFKWSKSRGPHVEGEDSTLEME
ncbi:MAG: hypothetical protein M1833_003150 [Piccolia ochrophora]|nr:MAG: hypothetical protein M1833_003150 [Piccolia ochrophora]